MSRWTRAEIDSMADYLVEHDLVPVTADTVSTAQIKTLPPARRKVHIAAWHLTSVRKAVARRKRPAKRRRKVDRVALANRALGGDVAITIHPTAEIADFITLAARAGGTTVEELSLRLVRRAIKMLIADVE